MAWGLGTPVLHAPIRSQVNVTYTQQQEKINDPGSSSGSTTYPQHLAQSEEERNARAAAGAPRPSDELLAGEQVSSTLCGALGQANSFS